MVFTPGFRGLLPFVVITAALVLALAGCGGPGGLAGREPLRGGRHTAIMAAAQQNEPTSVRDHGAVGDGKTDDYAAFAAAIDAVGPDGGEIRIPEGRYRLSQPLVLTRGVHLVGERHGSNPGVVAGINHPYPAYVLGSVLYFDPGVSGIRLFAHTDEPDPTAVRKDLDAKSVASAYYEFPGATHSSIENLAILSAGGGTADTHGIETRTVVTLRNLRVQNFGGSGVVVSASSDFADATGSSYGNASLTVLDNVSCIDNRGHGFDVRGRDASVVKFDTCNAIINGGWGFVDQGLLGNTYVNCHAATNNMTRVASDDVSAGSFKATSAVAPHVYLGCYVEMGQGSRTELTSACTVVGGILASDLYHAPDSPAYVLNAGTATRKPSRHLNKRDPQQPVGFSAGYDDGRVCFAFGAAEDGAALDQGGMGWKMHYRMTGTRWFSLAYANSPAAMALQLPTSGAEPRLLAPAFPNGLYLKEYGDGANVHITSGTAPPTAGTWKQGDYVMNANIASGQPRGWGCSTGGTPGTWIPDVSWP